MNEILKLLATYENRKTSAPVVDGHRCTGVFLTLFCDGSGELNHIWRVQNSNNTRNENMLATLLSNEEDLTTRSDFSTIAELTTLLGE